MDIKRGLLVLLFIIILINGCIPQQNFKSQRSPGILNDDSQGQVTESEGLGRLCLGKEQCTSFCQNNRGRCESYCSKNENELCKAVFSNQFTPLTPGIRNRCVRNSEPVFKSHFTDISKIRSISPPGGIAVGSQSRSYVFAKAHENGTYPMIPIYAPADSILEGITYAMRGSAPKGRPEYRLDLRVSCEVTIHFDHVPYVTDKIKQEGPKTPASDTRTGALVSIPIKEGELLGYTDAALVPGFDFFLFNYAKTLEHINPSRWTSVHNKHADCPYDYFTEDLRYLYYSYFASAGGEIQANPYCRSASRDVAGTIAGGWFEGSSNDMQGTRLLVGSDFGSWVDLVIDEENLPRFSVRDYKGKNPEDVKAGESVCYFGPDTNSHAFLYLIDDNDLAVSWGFGPCPSSFPDKNYRIFQR